jgi:hypothetical protein
MRKSRRGRSSGSVYSHLFTTSGVVVRRTPRTRRNSDERGPSTLNLIYHGMPPALGDEIPRDLHILAIYTEEYDPRCGGTSPTTTIGAQTHPSRIQLNRRYSLIISSRPPSFSTRKRTPIHLQPHSPDTAPSFRRE